MASKLRKKNKKDKNLAAVLLEDVPKLGQFGQVKKIKAGFYQFLAKKNKVVLLTKEIEADLEKIKTEARAKIEVGRLGAENFKNQIEALTYFEKLNVGSHGEIYNSVAKEQIKKFLLSQNLKIEKSQVELDRPIRELGDHSVKIHLGHGLAAELKIVLEPIQA